MRTARALCIGVAFIGVAGVGRIAPSAHASPDSQSWYERWFREARNDIGTLLFHAAWPTATYEGIRMADIKLTQRGADITFRVWGRSWLEGEIWTDVIVKFGRDRIEDIAWGRHSWTLFEPGETLANTVELLKQLSTSQPNRPSAPASASYAALCVYNASASTIVYDINWGSNHDEKKLPAGEAIVYSAPGGAQDFSVTFDTSFAEGYTGRTIRMPAALFRERPEACRDTFTYQFTTVGQRIGLAPMTWTPGAEHPYVPHVLAGAEGWACAPGYRWLDPDDPDDVRCISSGR
jgi:hypothetical protein